MNTWEELYRRWRLLEGEVDPDKSYGPTEHNLRGYHSQEVRRVVFGGDRRREANRPRAVTEESWQELRRLGDDMAAADEDCMSARVERVYSGLKASHSQKVSDRTLRWDAQELAERPGIHEVAPFDDPYHAALFMPKLPTIFDPAPDSWYFRGQNGTWPLLAGAYRQDVQLVAAIARVRAFVADLRDHFDELRRLSDLELAAIAQHYIARTWFLDFSADPFVALFFTTDPVREGKTGVHLHISVDEWDAWSVHGTNVMGRLQPITVDAPRIRNQDWVSLAAEPVLLRLAATRTLYIRQPTADCVFHDRTRHPSVSPNDIYPPAEDDPYRHFADAWKAARGETNSPVHLEGDLTAAPLDAEPPVPRELSAEIFTNIAASWVDATFRGPDPTVSHADRPALAARAEELGIRWAELLARVWTDVVPPDMTLPQLRLHYHDLVNGLSLEMALENLGHNLRRNYAVDHPIIEYLDEWLPHH